MAKRQLHCIVCAKPMQIVTVAGGVEIDCCDEHGVWLDVGELAALLNHSQATAAVPPRVVQQPQPAPPPAPPPPPKPSILEGTGKRLLNSAASGAGFGAGYSLASTLVRKIFG